LENSESPKVGVRLDERKAGDIGTVTLDNARALNAMSSVLMDALIEAFRRLSENERLRAVVLTGAGVKAFSAGADINEMAKIENATQARAYITRLHHCCDAIRHLPVPVIARIHGYCFGGGLELAAACDIRIADETARFGMQEVKIGIPSVIEAALLPTLVGWARTREMLYLGETFSAAEALSWGLVERVVPAAALDEEVEGFLGKLLTSAPRAVRLQKKLIRQWEDLPLSAAVAAGIDAFAAAYKSDEPIVAMREFLAAQKARKRG
jgi:enoyl-CoA hydratase/carnithine racemase